MTTLLEIESAAESLPQQQQFELLAFLSTRLVSAGCEPDRKTGTASSPEQQFSQFASAWRRDTAVSSSLTEMFAHPAYQRIVGMGAVALPMIFRELATGPDYWFGALQAITGCNPVPPDHRGDLEAMTADWLAWGRERGLVSP